MNTAAERRRHALQVFFGGATEGSTVVLGIGNPLCGDDNLGCEMARRLGCRGFAHALVCDELPENYTAEVKSLNPRRIILVDAVDFHAAPGDVVCLHQEELQSDRFNTHKPSLGLLMHYLAAETGAKVALIGVQPKNRALHAPISPEVEESINLLVMMLSDSTLPVDQRKTHRVTSA